MTGQSFSKYSVNAPSHVLYVRATRERHCRRNDLAGDGVAFAVHNGIVDTVQFRE